LSRVSPLCPFAFSRVPWGRGAPAMWDGPSMERRWPPFQVAVQILTRPRLCPSFVSVFAHKIQKSGSARRLSMSAINFKFTKGILCGPRSRDRAALSAEMQRTFVHKSKDNDEGALHYLMEAGPLAPDASVSQHRGGLSVCVSDLCPVLWIVTIFLVWFVFRNCHRSHGHPIAFPRLAPEILKHFASSTSASAPLLIAFRSQKHIVSGVLLTFSLAHDISIVPKVKMLQQIPLCLHSN